MQRDPQVWGPDAASFVPERFVRQAPAQSSDESEGEFIEPTNDYFVLVSLIAPGLVCSC